MIGRYNMADVYVDVASIEGFCLPLYEAMRCGVPVISVRDNFVRQEVHNYIKDDRNVMKLLRPSDVPDER